MARRGAEHFAARLPYGQAHLLVACDAAVDRGVDDAVQAHAEQADVAMRLLVLILADQGPQLLVLILHHLDGILQRAHLHLGTQHTVSLQAQGPVLPHHSPEGGDLRAGEPPCSYSCGLEALALSNALC